MREGMSTSCDGGTDGRRDEFSDAEVERREEALSDEGEVILLEINFF